MAIVHFLLPVAVIYGVCSVIFGYILIRLRAVHFALMSIRMAKVSVTMVFPFVLAVTVIGYFRHWDNGADLLTGAIVVLGITGFGAMFGAICYTWILAWILQRMITRGELIEERWARRAASRNVRQWSWMHRFVARRCGRTLAETIDRFG